MQFKISIYLRVLFFTEFLILIFPTQISCLIWNAYSYFRFRRPPFVPSATLWPEPTSRPSSFSTAMHSHTFQHFSITPRRKSTRQVQLKTLGIHWLMDVMVPFSYTSRTSHQIMNTWNYRTCLFFICKLKLKICLNFKFHLIIYNTLGFDLWLPINEILSR